MIVSSSTPAPLSIRGVNGGDVDHFRHPSTPISTRPERFVTPDYHTPLTSRLDTLHLTDHAASPIVGGSLSSSPTGMGLFGRNMITRSRSSSMSQASSTSRHFAHYREPTVLEKPDTVDDIRDALAQGDISSLAELVQEHGLPPSLRPAAWPRLLEKHPLVKNALERYGPQSDVKPVLNTDLPLKRIRGDITRMRRKNGLSKAEEADIYETVVRFLCQYGSIIPYEVPMVWVAEFLLNGDRQITPYRNTMLNSEISLPALEVESPELHMMSSPEPISGSSTPNLPLIDSSSELTSPTMANISLGAPAQSFARGRASVSSNDSDGSVVSFSGIDSKLLQATFDQVMLLMHEMPEMYSEFVTLLRTYLPNVGSHFASEGILSVSGGDDWLTWWLRWLGVRAFPSDVLARFWDTYFSSHLGGEALMKQHLFNCIVLIRGSRSTLGELDQSECRQLLLHLPPCKDVEAVLVEGKQLTKTN